MEPDKSYLFLKKTSSCCMPVTASNDSVGSHLSGVFGGSLSKLNALLPLAKTKR